MYLVCDGSRRGEWVGAGVIVVDGTLVEQYAFEDCIPETLLHHEEYAVGQALEQIPDTFKGRMTVYNDHYYEEVGKQRPYIQERLDLLEKNGVRVEFLHPKQMPRANRLYYPLAHSLSRKYMSHLPGAISVKERFAQKATVRNRPIFQANKRLLSGLAKGQRFLQGTLGVSFDEWKRTEAFVFQKIANGLWGVFSREETLMFAHADFMETMRLFLSFLEQDGRTSFSINEHVYFCVSGSMSDGAQWNRQKQWNELLERFARFDVTSFQDARFTHPALSHLVIPRKKGKTLLFQGIPFEDCSVVFKENRARAMRRYRNGFPAFDRPLVSEEVLAERDRFILQKVGQKWGVFSREETLLWASPNLQQLVSFFGHLEIIGKTEFFLNAHFLCCLVGCSPNREDPEWEPFLTLLASFDIQTFPDKAQFFEKNGSNLPDLPSAR